MVVSQWLWRILGLLAVGCAYVGAIVPGVPTTTFVIIAVWCFAKSSPRLHSWLINHPLFGKHIHNWTNYRIYPAKARYLMVACCVISLIWMWLMSVSITVLGSVAVFMLCVIVWAFRYPGSLEEYHHRVAQGKKIGWLR